MINSILFVCHGNICRSPMAEFILKYLTDNTLKISSRGTSNEEDGHDMHPRMKALLDKHNIPYTKHYAKRITIDDYHNFDLIVCFDDYNIYNIERITHDTSKVIKLLPQDVSDPWYTGDFDASYQDIYNGCLNLITKIKNQDI